MYVIDSIVNDEQFLCKRQGKFKLNHELTPNLNWSNVGVFKLGPLMETLEVILKKDIAGKVIKVNNYLITCPFNVLFEQ